MNDKQDYSFTDLINEFTTNLDKLVKKQADDYIGRTLDKYKDITKNKSEQDSTSAESAILEYQNLLLWFINTHDRFTAPVFTIRSSSDTICAGWKIFPVYRSRDIFYAVSDEVDDLLNDTLRAYVAKFKKLLKLRTKLSDPLFTSPRHTYLNAIEQEVFKSYKKYSEIEFELFFDRNYESNQSLPGITLRITKPTLLGKLLKCIDPNLESDKIA